MRQQPSSPRVAARRCPLLVVAGMRLMANARPFPSADALRQVYRPVMFPSFGPVDGLAMLRSRPGSALARGQVAS
jgi:hypothetical protein